MVGPTSCTTFASTNLEGQSYTQPGINSTSSAGKPIGAYDLLIAGQALHRKLTLVTANAKEFGRIKSLLWEDWGKL
jgi:hypothetical protein